jgi:alkanesulfonate monooxygenase SsuD/methylene tetrahydromethanopterin reductase-like flavin-dependent oxidoreductase (luciferase family)
MAVFAESPDAVPAARTRLEAAWDHWDIAPERRGGVVGTPAEVAQQLQPWLDAGVTHLVLQPMEDADRTAFVRGAGEVAALLRATAG